MSKHHQQKLREVLDASTSTAAFLQDVISTIERLYAESDSECPVGFTALDSAVDAFAKEEGEW